MKDFTAQAKCVWAAHSGEDKRQLLLKIVKEFDHKQKQAAFRKRISECSSPTELDKLASQLVLFVTDKVV